MLKTIASNPVKLSNPSKMPCPAWGIPATHCKTGSALRLIPHTTCSVCFAHKGRFSWNTIQQAYQARLDQFNELPTDVWIDSMVFAIASTSTRFFRWFDSGDIQSDRMLRAINTIALRMPKVQFWLPTQERKQIMESTINFAPNLTIRLSAVNIGGVPPDYPTTSHLIDKTAKRTWADRVQRNTDTLFYCPAPLQHNKCGTCRACWNKDVFITAYLQH